MNLNHKRDRIKLREIISTWDKDWVLWGEENDPNEREHGEQINNSEEDNNSSNKDGSGALLSGQVTSTRRGNQPLCSHNGSLDYNIRDLRNYTFSLDSKITGEDLISMKLINDIETSSDDAEFESIADELNGQRQFIKQY